MENKVKKWSISNPWSSWNRQRINSVMRIITLSEIRIGILDKNNNDYSDNFTWVGVAGNKSIDYSDFKGVYKTDYHSTSGNYSKIGLYYKDFKFDLEFAGEGDDFVYKVIPRVFSENYKIFVGFLIGAQKDKHDNGSIITTENGAIIKTNDGSYNIEIIGEKSLARFAAPYPGLFFKSSSNIYIKCNNNRNILEADDFLYSTREAYMKKRVYGEGFLGEGIVESIIKAMSWNKVYDNFHDTFKSDVTRLWEPKSCYYTFYWDNFFTSLLYALEDEKMAYDQVDSVCSEFKNGFLPQAAWEWGSTNMINPPVGSYCLIKLFRQHGDRELLESYFDKLYSTNTYLLKKRSFLQDGVMQLKEWLDTDELNAFNDVLATGLDNSPMYDNSKDNNLNDIGMSSIFALDCKMLSYIAEILGRDNEKSILQSRYEIVKKEINSKMWDEKVGIYCNTSLSGEYCRVYSPTSFYPMIAGIASTEQVDRMIKEHLLNEEEFWGEYVIPSITKNHAAYKDQDYWRGCVWPPMNLLVYEGLKVYGYYNIAHDFAMKTLDLYKKNWVDFGYVPENISTKTGGITKNTVPMYTWGGLLPYIAIEEVFEVLIEGGFKFGNLSEKEAEIKNLRAGKDTYDIYTGEYLRVIKNNQKLIETDVPVIIRNFIISDEVLKMEIIAAKPGKCIVYSRDKKVEKEIDGEFKLIELYNIFA